jgi:hypothetical protein
VPVATTSLFIQEEFSGPSEELASVAFPLSYKGKTGMNRNDLTLLDYRTLKACLIAPLLDTITCQRGVGDSP